MRLLDNKTMESGEYGIVNISGQLHPYMETADSLHERGSDLVVYSHSFIEIASVGVSGIPIRGHTVNLDVDVAFKVVMMDDEVDGFQKEAYDQIKQVIRENSDHVTYLINLFLISRHLERIADHATNIAEEVIYLIEGEIIRHGRF